MTSSTTFRKLILHWFDLHGRKNLPWQHNQNPYRVWVSEIMLQQTQVATVIPYFKRFMERFPDIEQLAAANLDDVLHLWAGLGYYSRARNLHRAAIKIASNKQFPNTIETLTKLPGIGRSTAGAIAAIAFKAPTAILDGNVKRVLARFYGISAPINHKHTETQLWDLADKLMPSERTGDYTQAMMDLGATLCTRSRPQCTICPLKTYCIAFRDHQVAHIPVKIKGRRLPRKKVTFLVIIQRGKVLLHRRPAVGIWGGLWSLPELIGEPSDHDLFNLQNYPIQANHISYLPMVKHSFTHFHLSIYPAIIRSKGIMKIDPENEIWYNPQQPSSVGLPKPVKTILEGLNDAQNTMHQTEKRSRRISATTTSRRSRSKNL